MLPPSLVWWVPGCIPHGIRSDPLFPANAWPQYTSDLKNEQAGTGTVVGSILFQDCWFSYLLLHLTFWICQDNYTFSIFRSPWHRGPIKGTIRRKPRWVKSGINRKLFLYCLAADICKFYLKGQYSLKSINRFQHLMITKISFVESM